ncbi:MAG: marine proteobacterial sortase target protein [Congregibacter sp.]
MHDYPHEPHQQATLQRLLQFDKVEQERLLRRLAVAIVLMMFLLILEASPAARADVGAEQGGPVMRLSAGAEPASNALQLESHLQLKVSGLLARGTLTQRFRNNSAEWREAEYLLPLPQDAAVTRLELQVGERTILGEIRERNAARQVYDAARKAGQRAALLEQQRPHLFTTRVANVPPGEEIAVRVEMVLPVRYRDGEFSLRFPTTVTPIYIPGLPLPDAESDESATTPWLPLNGSGWAAATHAVPDAPLLTTDQYLEAGDDHTPLNPLSIQITLQAGMPLAQVEALYHDLQVDRVDGGFDLSLRDGRTEMDRDLVLRWTPTATSTPQAAVFREAFDGDEFALLMLLPPQAALPASRLPRELILVIDVSGSMQGEPIRQARASVLHSLTTLHESDYVNIIAFSDHHKALFREARRADAQTLATAERFVRGLDASGGTEMYPALETALALPMPSAANMEMDDAGEVSDADPLRQLIFVTDGAIGNEDALLSLLEAKARNTRVFTVGIGSAPNSYFMHRAAEAGRGETVFIARPSDVAPRLNALFERIDRPLARDLRVHWPASAEVFPLQIPDLYARQPLMQVARFTGPVSGGTIRVQGQLAGRAWERQIALPETQADNGVAQHWARQKLAAIMQAGRRGAPRDVLKERALPVALRFSLASPFTSFVALEAQPVRPAEARVAAAKLQQVRPQDQAATSIAFAQGATSGPVKLYLSLFFAFVALIAHALNRSEP